MSKKSEAIKRALQEAYISGSHRHKTFEETLNKHGYKITEKARK